ncbi:MAG: hypothetical protein JO126_07650 [Alphaproteobacteria bacterium]|nr:hypothetical protein [Alphaproteobacteria bacterium]
MSDLSTRSELPVSPEGSVRPEGPSWQDQDPVLRDMWLQMKTPQEISAVLNRSVPAIMTRAARLGLPRRAAPGRKPGRRAVNPDGTPQVYQPRVRAAAAYTADAPAAVVSLRVCLMCLKQFESAGRHNRICNSCKGSGEYSSASALGDMHLSG